LNDTHKIEPQYDGPYEVSAVELQNEGDVFKGVVYFPPETYSKPYPVILYFHGFPQLFTLPEIVKKYKYLLDAGFAFVVVNFRGYRYSEGVVSLSSQVSDGLKLVDFAEKMGEKNIFDPDKIQILAHDLGAYISLIVCSKTSTVKKLLLLNPIIDLKAHVYDDTFSNTLHYINRYLPGNVQGVEQPEEFVEMTKSELSRDDFQLKTALKNLKVNFLKIITGEKDKVTQLSELDVFNQIDKPHLDVDLCVIEDMDHEPIDDEKIQKIAKEIQNFF
jgi:dipeptidyl aminopeptidase/acylaminoacyl peptidase